MGDAKVSGNSRDGGKMLPGTRRFENTGVDDILNERKGGKGIEDNGSGSGSSRGKSDFVQLYEYNGSNRLSYSRDKSQTKHVVGVSGSNNHT